jgi:hypothetical protein
MSHGRDCQTVFLAGNDHAGYLPEDLGIGGGDALEIDYCLECGQIQGTWPLPLSELETAGTENDEDY